MGKRASAQPVATARITHQMHQSRSMYVSPQSTITLLHDMMLAGRHIIASSSRLLWSITISSSHTVGSRPCSCRNASNTRSHS